jgi:hypothetical protein
VFVLLLALAQELRADERLAFAVWRPGDDVPRELRELRRSGVDAVLVDGAPASLPDVERLPLGVYLDGHAPAEALRLFLERVPPAARALVDGRLLAVLGPPPESGRGVPDLNALGAPLHLMVEAGWTEAPAAPRWKSGLPEDGPLTAVGGRTAEEVEKAWCGALRLEARWVLVETWAPELGESTARHVRKLRLREKTALPKGKWTGAEKALYTAKYPPHEQGLRPLSTEEGSAERVQLRGVALLASKEAKKGDRRRVLSFDVDDSFAYFEKRSYTLTLEFLDLGVGVFRVEYDAAERRLPPAERHVKPAGEVAFGGTGDWKEVTIDLPDALFGNGQPGGADLRLVLEGRGVALRRIALRPR